MQVSRIARTRSASIGRARTGVTADDDRIGTCEVGRADGTDKRLDRQEPNLGRRRFQVANADEGGNPRPTSASDVRRTAAAGMAAREIVAHR